MLWENPMPVNLENSLKIPCENNLIDCSGLLKYHLKIPLTGGLTIAPDTLARAKQLFRSWFDTSP